MPCDKTLPIIFSPKKIHTNDPEIYMEAGTRDLVRLAPFVTVPFNIPKQNTLNAVVIGKKKSGMFNFKKMKSAKFTQDPSNPKFAKDVVFDASKIKKGDGILIGKKNILDVRPASTLSDYDFFTVDSIDLREKSVCLIKRAGASVSQF